MKLLFLSFYFPPDLCAGSFRANALLNSLKSKMKNKDSLTILTTKPNRYSDFLEKSETIEMIDNIRIVRIKVPTHSNKFFDQSLCFLFYFVGVLCYCYKKDYDIVIGTSSRLFTAFLAKLISFWKKIPLYLDIRDIFFEVFKDLSKDSYMRILMPIIKVIERFTFSSVAKMNIVSQGFYPYFVENYNLLELTIHSNGIDEEFNCYKWTKPTNERIKVCYAGNIGEGQGLHKIIPDLACELTETHDFYITGNGGKMTLLKNILNARKIKNVYLKPSVKRDYLLKFYNSADILFLHLNNLPAFEKVLPSKIFEYAATGKPILAGVSGYSREFIRHEVKNSKTFEPCCLKEAKIKILQFNLDMTDRHEFKMKYDRKKLMSNMADDILSIIR